MIYVLALKTDGCGSWNPTVTSRERLVIKDLFSTPITSLRSILYAVTTPGCLFRSLEAAVVCKILGAHFGAPFPTESLCC